MKWLKLFSRKRGKEEDPDSEAGDIVAPPADSDDESQQTYASSRKRRSVSMDLPSQFPSQRVSFDRPSGRTSLEIWHEARRTRNSTEMPIVTTDKLSVCKAGGTAIINRRYITVKPLGAGTYGSVVLCVDVADSRLCAVKCLRKSQVLGHPHHFPERRKAGRTSSSFSSLTSNGSLNGSISQFNGSFNNLMSLASGGGGGNGGGLATAGGFGQTATAGNSAAGGFGQVPGAGAAGGAVFGRPNADYHTVMAAVGAAAQVSVKDGASGARKGDGLAAGFSNGSVGGGFGAGSVGGMGQLRGASSAQGPFSINAHSGNHPPPGRCPTVGSAAGFMSVEGRMGAPGFSRPSCEFAPQAAPAQATTARTEEFVREIAVLKKLRHPNVVRLNEVIDDARSDSLLLVMEYVEGRTLEPVRASAPPASAGPASAGAAGAAPYEPLEEAKIWRYCRDVLQGLDYLHSHHVVHGDLKPANLLMDSNAQRVKIVDFGNSRILGAGGAPSAALRGVAVGTPAFRCPESLQPGYEAGYAADLWALGCCLYLWAYGDLPFPGTVSFVIYEKIRVQEVTLPSEPDVSPPLQELIRLLLCKDPSARPTAAQALAHPWVTLAGTMPLLSQQQQQQQQAAALASAACSSLFGSAAAGTASGPSAPSSKTQSSAGQSDAFGAGLGGASPAALDAWQLTAEEVREAVHEIEHGTSELMELVFKEVHYQDREELIAAGDLADKLVLIASGEVEIFQCGWPSAIGAPWPGEDPSGVPLQDQLVRGSILRNDSGSRRFGAQPQRSGDRGSGAAGAVAATGGSAGPAAVASPSAVLLGSHSISEDPNDPFEPLEAAGVRVLDAATARPAVLQSLDSVDSALRARGAAHRPTSLDTCRVLAVRGAGECLGFPSLRPQDRKVWQASVRARGKVCAFVAQSGELLTLVQRYPEMEAAVQTIIRQQETDMEVLEAMRQLSLMHETACAQRREDMSIDAAVL